MGEVSVEVLRDSPALILLWDGRLHSIPAQFMVIRYQDCIEHTLPHAGDYGTVNPGAQMCHPTSRGHG